jgi:hypothetical protein
MCKLSLIHDRTLRFPLVAHTELFSNGFCPLGRLHEYSVLPALELGAPPPIRECGFLRCRLRVLYIGYQIYFIVQPLLIILVMNFDAFTLLLGFAHCQVFPNM